MLNLMPLHCNNSCVEARVDANDAKPDAALLHWAC